MEETKKIQSTVISDYEKIVEQGSIGFYEMCEVTTIFLSKKSTSEAFNYFSIFTFQEERMERENAEYLTDKLHKVTENISLGICRYYLTMEEAQDSFNQMQKSQILDNKGGVLKIGKLNLIPKQFVPNNSTNEILLNRTLKNNFMNGSYLLEFFDNEKSVVSNLTEHQRLAIAKVIIEHVPIDLQVIQDRVGNIIFQFPSNIINLEMRGNQDNISLNFKFNVDKRVEAQDRYWLLVSTKFDGAVIGSKYIRLEDNSDFQLDLGDTSQLINTKVYDTKLVLLVNESDSELIARIDMRTNMYLNKEVRTIFNQSDNIIEIELEKPIFSSISNDNTNKTWKLLVADRQYKERLNELEKQKKFMQYGTTPENNNNKALNDIRELINKYSEKRIMLWDPYLTAKDIVDTLFFCGQSGVEMRAITSSLASTRTTDRENQVIQDWIESQKQIFNNCSNNLGINLEFRCQYGHFGSKFHDRFLMFEKNNGATLAWSLGTSVNSLGDSHHIIQEVSHPKYMVGSFNNLWNELEDEGCLVWKFN